jgi:hypothetical protein
MSADMEASCDESVIRDYEPEQRAAYGETLLRLAVKKPRFAGSPLAFGESGAKSRVRHALFYKRPAFWAVVVAALACLAAAFFLLSNPAKKTGSEHLGVYAFDEVLYQNPLSSYYPVGTTGFLYELSENAFTIKIEESGEVTETISPVDWEAQTAITVDEWRLLFDTSFDLYQPPELPRDAKLVTVSDQYRLLFSEEQVWLATTGGRENLLWSVYRLVPAGTSSVGEPAAVDPPVTADAGERIDALLAVITSSPAEASNPGSYIEAHPEEYRELLSLGNETLHYIFRAFLRGGQTDLNAHIMGAALRDLIGEGYEIPVGGTPQENFDRWKAQILALRKNDNLAYFETNDPPAYLLLTMLAVTDEAVPDFAISPTAEKYYDYFMANNHVSFLLADELAEPGFSDAELSYYALSELIRGNPDYEQLAGFPVEDFNAVTLRYFGRTVENHENRAATILDNGNITPTGWGGNSVALVLKELEPAADGRISAVFYQFSFGIGEDLPAPEVLKERLLAGKSEEFGPCWLVRMEFTEQAGEDGAFRLLFHDVEALGEVQPPYPVYQEIMR